jgi:microcephalin
VQLGATVEPKLTNEVTHVIFKDGKKSTRDKAKKKGVHLVSVLWIEACKRNGGHVPEMNYPANVKDDTGLPLAITRLKVSFSF